LELIEKATTGSPASEVGDVAVADAVVVESKVPVKMGKWRLVPPGAEDDTARS
jgi:hypothetical protein